MISIKLFAYLAEIVDLDEIKVEIAETEVTPVVIKAQVAAAYPVLKDYLKTVRFAVDQVFVEDDLVINVQGHHEYALIPPVSGG